MSEKSSKQELAYEFRNWLCTDLIKADKFLAQHPFVLDYPVYGRSESAIDYFVTENELDIVRWLVERGANVNGIGEKENPLHVAALMGHFEMVKLLLSSGAAMDDKDHLEETALHKASLHDYVNVIELLLQAGADPTIKEMCGELPVDQALPRKAEEVRAAFVKYLR